MLLVKIMDLYKAVVINFIYDVFYLKTDAHRGAMLWVRYVKVHGSM